MATIKLFNSCAPLNLDGRRTPLLDEQVELPLHVALEGRRPLVARQPQVLQLLPELHCNTHVYLHA